MFQDKNLAPRYELKSERVLGEPETLYILRSVNPEESSKAGFRCDSVIKDQTAA